HMLAGMAPVRAGRFDLLSELGGEVKHGRRVLSVDHRKVRLQLALQPRQDRLDRLTPRMSDDVRDEQDPELVRAHRSIVGKNKREPDCRAPLESYFAYSTALVSRTTVPRICQGKLSSDSLRLAMSRAISWAAASSICSGSTG